MKRTIAILGENVEHKLEIAFGLATASYPVVLQVEADQEKGIKRKISKRRVNISIATHTDSFSCAWEADVIIIVDCLHKLTILAKEIENYVTGKIIIVLLDEKALSVEVKSSFRYAKNVFVYNPNQAVDSREVLDFFNLAFSSEIRLISSQDAGCKPLTADVDYTANLVEKIERLLDVFY